MWNIPNTLTTFRLFLIPVFAVVFYLPYSWAFFAAAFIFWLASITDILDGYLARKLNQSTPFGAFLDPVADKVMVSVALVLIAAHYQNVLVTLAAVIIISREIVISALREWMAGIGKRASVAVSNLGKFKTAAQMLAIIGLIWQFAPWMIMLSYALLAIATLLTIVSMLQYLFAAKGELLKS
ncbi:CDP-diacylglycerol--glycerol-3-phosphate 3-phosphatidyltransferase [Pseudoalteromonas luteoviolacea]|uniref:CDP-diacylglycerol--glycerol-3-phosphate 3-phosphatidyltransferase n=1 Tax=Pseudoalteromonas luteoviolacea DSM 6061 TaxID=1365250 RepID=A0A167AAW6_9GAMM|nr:CDP-diacylglycerol--glycerol-3-phosphate 3-phosphatidyltransferase [Pseudoalteromonas luteoviolacea]KZN45172.1 CDP-diacylglycerol--glycerol-3-phosphate 3-phosphatidyltransferase [Pseudoalteromonas luteoviolacea DSM 6061]KZN60518.1 CDP-diacylglycerol--glycerol-3-phosphate 3-phosphatidyltransferase [Pseudoalteromonas luteoviolacea CPMOR-2]MBE0386741.1 CDP-diacylglycerol--glycerol-3-phosphate 3-phosphatidyltransferase [Pseudoalteromonas luteoviolacea DSM 6061]TQF71580.1 CDP-diacylglycerol--glyc